MEWDKNVGVCVKSQTREVLYQNQKCMMTCGPTLGQVCNIGCTPVYTDGEDEKAFDEGLHKFTAIKTKVGPADIVVINDGQNLTTILYPLKEKKEKQTEFLKKYRLTKSEMNIIFHVMEGSSNAQIAEMLFISKSTLRTHLNNIYKKLPKHVQEMVRKSR